MKKAIILILSITLYYITSAQSKYCKQQFIGTGNIKTVITNCFDTSRVDTIKNIKLIDSLKKL